MKASWDDLNARAQGLSTRLLGRAGIEALLSATGLDDLARRLGAAGFGPLQGPASPAALEGAVRRSAGERLSILARWCGPRAQVLAVVFEDEDRRSLRALLRGLIASAPPEVRLRGLLPTPALPPRALEELARMGDLAQLAATLRAWGNPYADALEAATRQPRPDLLQWEVAMTRLFAQRAAKGARRGDRVLKRFVAESIDVENALAAVVLAPQPADQEPEKWFVPGGRALARDAFGAAIRAPGRTEALRALAQALAGTPLAEALAQAPEALDKALLAARAREGMRAARLQPLTSQPLLSFALRLRAQTLDLMSVIWAVALGAPPRGLQLASPP